MFEVEAADYHRNGVGGMGFNVAIVNDTENGRMLVVDFNEKSSGDRYTAVLNLDEAAKGNIFMHAQVVDENSDSPGTGLNAWRGDVLGDLYRQAIRDHVRTSRDQQLALLSSRYKNRDQV